MNQLSGILRINPFVSMTFKESDIVIASLYGKIKKIKCDVTIFKEILSFMDGVRSINQILNILKHKYSEEFLNRVFSILTESEIIVTNSIEPSQQKSLISADYEINNTLIEKLKVTPVGTTGSGLIAQSVMDIMEEICGNSSFKMFDVKMGVNENIEHLIEIFKESNIDFLIACPEKATYGWLWTINEVCLALKLPWLICYFNGKNIILGPTLIPGKTPCYGCLLEYRLNHIYENSGLKLSLKDIFKIVECWPLPRTSMMSIIGKWVGGLIVSEALRLIDGTVYPQFIKRQIYIPSYLTTSFKGVHFEAITTCMSCHGLNRDNLTIGRPRVFVPPDGSQVIVKNIPLQHTDGGYRALAAEDARKLINNTLKKMGISVKIEKSTKGPLDEILPSYMAQISNFYSKDFPVLITEKNQWGKGVTDEQAFLSGAFELFERICSEYHGNVEMIRAPYRDVQNIAIDVEAQIGTVYFDRGIDRFDEDMAIDWVWGYSLIRERPLLVPASMVYLTKSKFCGHFHASTSGGLAAGTSIEDAILQGLMETIEHDAWMIWQANAVTTPQVQNKSIKDATLLRIIDEIEKAGFCLIIRYQPTDIGIPVFRTWLVNEKDYIAYAGNGLGANLDSKIALKRSITEAKLYLPSYKKQEKLHYGISNNLDLLNNKTSLFYLYHFNKTDILNEDHPRTFIDFDEIPTGSTGSISGDIKKAVGIIKKSVPHSDVVVVNLGKELLNIPVVKVISVGLQRLSEPIQCAQKRLFQLPIALGYRDYELTYPQLYNDRYPR
jgi:thiazole/oxazole-forming peptide maturase SagD family component